MQHPSSRPLRIGEQLRREIANLLCNRVKDPRISEIVIYEVVMSHDLGTAKVYFGPVDFEQDPAEMIKGLESASGFLRTQLSRTLHLRKTPVLRFIVDETELKSARLEQLIRESLNK